jgi:hypothetical protein
MLLNGAEIELEIVEFTFLKDDASEADNLLAKLETAVIELLSPFVNWLLSKPSIIVGFAIAVFAICYRLCPFDYLFCGFRKIICL